jgi:hypothetical protein
MTDGTCSIPPGTVLGGRPGGIRQPRTETTIMAQWEITHSCAHTVTHQLCGPVKDRASRAEWLESRDLIEVLMDPAVYTKRGRLKKSCVQRALGWSPKQVTDALRECRAIVGDSGFLFGTPPVLRHCRCIRTHVLRHKPFPRQPPTLPHPPPGGAPGARSAAAGLHGLIRHEIIPSSRRAPAAGPRRRG